MSDAPHGKAFFHPSLASLIRPATALLQAALLALPWLGAPAQLHACTLTQVASLPLTLTDDKLVISALIGATPARLAVDTGAALSFISLDIAARARLAREPHSLGVEGAGGTFSQVDVVDSPSLTLGSQSIGPVRLGVIRLTLTNGRPAPFDGLLGADILSRFEIELDLPANRMQFWQASHCAAGDSALIPAWAMGGHRADLTIAPDRRLHTQIELEASRIDLLLDTGAPGLLLSNRAAASTLGDDWDRGARRPGRAVNGQSFSAEIARIGRLRFAGRQWHGVNAAIAADGRFGSDDGLLGIDPFLRGRHVQISYTARQIFFAD